MANFTMADLKRMREQREQRISEVKAEANNESKEYLIQANLAKGSTLWFPKKDKPEEVEMRIVDFMVTKEDNVAGDSVGKFTAIRHFKVHYLPNKEIVVCPTSYGKPCPLCEYYNDHYDEAKANQQHPANRFKAKKITMFNAFVKIASPDGKTKTVPRVVRGNSFFLITALNKSLSEEVQFNPKKENTIYAYSDLELGYWVGARFGMAPAVAGNSNKYMQLLKADLHWKEKPTPIDEKLFGYITDLDALIPDAPSYDTLRKLIGIDAVKEEVEDVSIAEEDVDIDLNVSSNTTTTEEDDGIDCGIPGAEVVEEDVVKTEDEVEVVDTKEAAKVKPETVESKETEEEKSEDVDSDIDADFDFENF